MWGNLFYATIIFLILFLISIFPHFRQTKKNLILLVLIFICVSAFMVIDLGLEFLPLAYLMIYVGAVAVMFLFVIVAVDPKHENQIYWFESELSIIIIANNFLSSVLYFIFTRAGSFPFAEQSNLLNFKEHVKALNLNRFPEFTNFSPHADIFRPENITINDQLSFYTNFVVNSGCVFNDLSLYTLVEYRLKDVYVFSEYFYNNHGFLLVIVSFVLTISMLVSLLLAKEFSNKRYET